MPGFFLGILLILIFSYWLGIFPSYGAHSTRSPIMNSVLLDSLWHMVLPVTVLGVAGAAATVRYMRSRLLDVLGEEYITAARARGCQPSPRARNS